MSRYQEKVVLLTCSHNHISRLSYYIIKYNYSFDLKMTNVDDSLPIILLLGDSITNYGDRENGFSTLLR